MASSTPLVLLLLLAADIWVLPGEAAPLPQGPYYKVYGSDITREGQTVTMDCLRTQQTAIVGHLSSTEWVKDGKVMAGQTSAKLTLYHVTRQDAGLYQCGEPGSDLHRMGLDLHVYVVGDVLPRPDVINQYDGLAVLGRHYSLQCIIRGNTYIANEATVYTWYKDSVEVKGQTGAVLLLPNVTQADEGKYRCTAREGPVETTSPASFDFDLTVFVSPQVRIKPSGPVVSGILGENLTLTCEVTRAEPYVPKDGYSWSYLPYPEAEQQPLGVTGRTLTLGPLTLEDRGQYVCQARNDQLFDFTKMSGHASVTVDVVYLENITLTSELEVNEGDLVTLTCTVDSHPTARLAWTVKGQEVRHVTDNLDHYVIMSAACSDSTNYTCHASNTEMPGRERNATTRVHVHCKQDPDEDRHPVPRSDKSETEVTATLHFSLPQMTSSVVVVHPSGRDVISVRQDCSIHLTPAFQSRCLQPRCDLERHHLTFTLTQVTGEDGGDYTCVEEGTRRPVSNCGTQLLVQKDAAQSDHQHSTIVALAVASSILLLLGMGFGIIIYHRIGINSKQAKNALSSVNGTKIEQQKQEQQPETDPVDVKRTAPTRTPQPFIQDRELTFESLYEKGKVYVFPQLPSQEEGTAPRSDDDTGDESQPLLGLPEVKEGDAEFKVINMLKLTLENSMSANQEDLPSFLLHNTRLSKQENVILVVDRKIGIVVMVTNLIKSSDGLNSQVANQVENLVQARDAVMCRLQGLVQLCDVTAVLSLPFLTPQQANDVKKQMPSLHGNVELLPGLDPAHCSQWMEGLRIEKASKVWRFSSQGDHPDTIYKKAACRFLTLAGCGGTGESSRSPDPAQSWLLTPAQVEVRDSTARLLHVWGPPGSGKTTLLVHRARQWLAEGNDLIFSTGKQFYDVKLAHIEKTLKGKNTEKIMCLCRTNEELERAMKQLAGTHPEKKICIIIDILCQKEILEKILLFVQDKKNVNVWTTSKQKLHAISSKLSKKASALGWESLELPACIRCTKDTVELLNLLGKDVYPPIPSCSLSCDPAWRVVDHCLHPDCSATLSKCNHCKSDMSQALPSQVPWNDWIALYTGPDWVSFKPMDEALRHMGVPSFCCPENYNRTGNADAAQQKDCQRFRELVHSGMDKDGNPVVHFLQSDDFTGMERKGVILVHFDKKDNDSKCQTREKRNARLEEHRAKWTFAVSRSKGHVILLLLTPSPARSLLSLPEPVMAQQSTSVQEETEVLPGT